MALMVEAGNPKELAQAVLLMSKKSNYFKEMSVRARAFAESELAPSHARNEYLRVIETCYNNHLSKRTK
jgi:hypothetical protein